MSWTELRSVALVGTENRQVTGVAVVALPVEAAPEVVAMHHASLLGVQRLAGKRIVTVAAEPEGDRVESPVESNAPREATQLIDLILGGNVVPLSMQSPLLRHWLDACVRGGHVVPHRVIVQLLDAGAQSKELRPHLRPALGHRGQWIAALNQRWAWAAGYTDASADVTTEAFESFGSEAKRQHLTEGRAADPGAAREFLGTVFNDLAAAHRAACVESLETGLSDSDEPFLEACLDDSSKNVRSAAQALLDGLPNSRRARRMAERLGPLVTIDGKLRRRLTVAWPDAPSKDEAREMTDRGSSIEASWLQAIVAGAPLSWWENRLGASPAEIVKLGPKPERELYNAWAVAAAAERSTPWADALVANGHIDARTVEVASDDVLAKAIAMLRKADDATAKRHVGLFVDRRTTWSLPYGEALLKYFEKVDPKKVPYHLFEAALADRLSPALAPRLERLLTKAPNDHERRVIRRILQSLTMQTSISTAFTQGAAP